MALVGATFAGTPVRPARTGAATPSPETFPLEHPPDCPRRLPAQGDAYEVDLPADTYLHAVFDQRGTDLAVTVFAPGHRRLYRVDSLNGSQGPEEVHLVSGEAGRYRFEVTGPPGDYCPELPEVRSPSPADRDQAAADPDLYLDPDLSPAAREQRYRRALRHLAETGGGRRQADALFRLAGPPTTDSCAEAIPLLAQAEALFSAAGERHLELLARVERGQCYRVQLDFEPAFATLKSALDLARQPGEPDSQATALQELGYLSQVRGHSWPALHFIKEAIALWQRIGARESEANSWTTLGWVYASTGDRKRAFAAHWKALSIRKRLAPPDPYEQAVSYLQIGSVLLHENPHRALPYVNEAWQLLKEDRSDAHRQDRAATLNGLGLALYEIGNYAEAQTLFQEALGLYGTAPPDLLGQATTLDHLGATALKLGRPNDAFQRFEQALALGRQAKDLLLQLRALEGLATVELLRNHLAAARARAEEAVEICEELRRIVLRPDLQTASTAEHFDAYRLLIRILMEQHRREPGAGHDREAFARSEQARARSLVEALRESRTLRHARQAGVQDALSELREIRKEIDQLGLLKNRPDADTGAIERKLSDLIDRASELDMKVRQSQGLPPAASPRFDWEQARRSLGPDTLLLEYSFGPQSYLWAVSADGLHSYPLPPGRDLEKLLRPTVEKLGKGESTDDSLRSLSDLLLKPVAPLLRGRQLLVAADGGAQYLPFAVLPDPNEPSRPLLVDHEISSIPSLSALIELRQRRDERAPAPLSLALFADPVFTRYDRRLPPDAEACDLSYLPRLTRSSREAKNIAALLPPGEVTSHIGFDATRDRVLDGSLGGYRYLHFATHGRLDTENPELSSLVLSRYDPQGRCRDGDLRVSDIQHLDLQADLAILSACKTALGRETPGEGLVGLPQAFLTAGASSVVVSLWRVEDHATAALMTELYRQLLREHQPPGQALRAAQLAMRKDPKWEGSLGWAAFVVQGDWR